MIAQHTAPLHPDDVAVVHGVAYPSLERTLVDCAEEMTIDELRELFANAHRRGLLDVHRVRRSAARAEPRPSLAMLHQVIDEFAT